MNITFVAMSLLDGLLLWAVIRTRGWWIPKALAIVLVLAFNFLLLTSTSSFSGWAASGDIPEGSKFVMCDVVEPNAIYLWVVPAGKPMVFGYHWIDGEPRAYRLPYTRQLHKECEAAKKAAAQGVSVGVGSVGKHPPSQGQGSHVFYQLPPVLPSKGETP